MFDKEARDIYSSNTEDACLCLSILLNNFKLYPVIAEIRFNSYNAFFANGMIDLPCSSSAFINSKYKESLAFLEIQIYNTAMIN